jgi:hypothetical protein
MDYDQYSDKNFVNRKLKPFNLQEALAGKPVVDGLGNPVVNFHYFKGSQSTQKLYGLDNTGEINSCGDDGQFFEGDKSPSKYDLFMASEKKEGWIAIGRMTQPSATVAFCTHVWATKEQAEAAYMPEGFPFSVQKITWEE